MEPDRPSSNLVCCLLKDLVSVMALDPATLSPWISFSLYICKPEKQYPLHRVVIRIKQAEGLIECLTLETYCFDTSKCKFFSIVIQFTRFTTITPFIV